MICCTAIDNPHISDRHVEHLFTGYMSIKDSETNSRKFVYYLQRSSGSEISAEIRSRASQWDVGVSAVGGGHALQELGHGGSN